MNFRTQILLISYLLFEYLFLIKTSECPRFSIQHIPRFFDFQRIKNYLKIPKTNILLINTISQDYLDSYDISNVVYYNDISKEVDNIINAIKPDYTVLQMEYIKQTNQLLILSPNKLITANVYTLQIQKFLIFRSTTGLTFIQDTDLAILTTRVCKFYIINVVEFKEVYSQDTCYYNYDVTNKLYSPKTYILDNGLVFIAIRDTYGFQAWSLSLDSNQLNFLNYLPEPQNQQNNFGEQIQNNQLNQRSNPNSGQNLQINNNFLQKLQFQQQQQQQFLQQGQQLPPFQSNQQIMGQQINNGAQNFGQKNQPFQNQGQAPTQAQAQDIKKNNFGFNFQQNPSVIHNRQNINQAQNSNIQQNQILQQQQQQQQPILNQQMNNSNQNQMLLFQNFDSYISSQPSKCLFNQSDLFNEQHYQQQQQQLKQQQKQ